jgi:hypothetical protein
MHIIVSSLFLSSLFGAFRDKFLSQSLCTVLHDLDERQKGNAQLINADESAACGASRAPRLPGHCCTVAGLFLHNGRASVLVFLMLSLEVLTEATYHELLWHHHTDFH